MPVHKVKGGYRWGKHGKVYKSRAKAVKQGKAAYASGYQHTGLCSWIDSSRYGFGPITSELLSTDAPKPSGRRDANKRNRPVFIICDDIGDEPEMSEERKDKIMEWFYKFKLAKFRTG